MIALIFSLSAIKAARKSRRLGFNKLKSLENIIKPLSFYRPLAKLWDALYSLSTPFLTQHFTCPLQRRTLQILCCNFHRETYFGVWHAECSVNLIAFTKGRKIEMFWSECVIGNASVGWNATHDTSVARRSEPSGMQPSNVNIRT